jgi:NADPH-dependent 2,4-dienoyl-CoA reductase/sulfur reductase-like enzyme
MLDRAMREIQRNAAWAKDGVAHSYLKNAGPVEVRSDVIDPSSRRAVANGSPDVVIIGAGPYGLSIAAHLRARVIDFRIFGGPMQSWRERMPVGMLLKSEGFASTLHDPSGYFTLERFCAENSLPYQRMGLPVPLETFTAYGLEFQQRLVPNLENRAVIALERSADGFLLWLDDGEVVTARRVVIAVGMTYFPHIPAALAHLPPPSFSHSSDHRNVSHFKGHDVTVIGGGASALDLVASLHDIGAEVRLIARSPTLQFNIPQPRPWCRSWYPTSALGGGLRNQFYEHAPMLFRRLPNRLRRLLVLTEFGPAGGATVKDRVERSELLLRNTIRYAQFHDRRVHLRLLGSDGEERTVSTDHVIAGTGYRVDLRRLSFLSREIRSQLRSVAFVPILSAEFESSIPDLYFVGLTAANTFGPSMRFVVGARFTARSLARHFSRTTSRK